MNSFFVCVSKSNPVGPLINASHADETGGYGYAMLSLMVSSLVICACVVLFVAYVYCAISCKGASGGRSLNSRA